MAYEHLVENFNTVSDSLSIGASEAFVAKAVGLGLVAREPNTSGIQVKKWTKKGYLTASALAENTDYTYDSNSELSDTSISTTLAKKQIPTKHSVEELEFGGDLSGWQRFEGEHGGALARLFDAELKALFTGLTNTAGGTGSLTEDHVFDARYNIESSSEGAFSGRLVGMLSYKQMNYLRNALKDSAASAFVSQVPLGDILGLPKVNGYSGSFAGVDFYQTSGIPTDSDQDWGAIWDPENCFCALVHDKPTSNELTFLGSTGGYNYELASWTFWDVKEWNDTAGCAIGSEVTS